MVGAILPFAGSTIPDGFLVCDGSAISRSEYSDLFEVIGTTYGAGDGTTTFNLPNMQGRATVGPDNGLALGSTGGEEAHVLLDTEIPEHTHSVPAHGHANDIVATTPELTHTVGQGTFTYRSVSTSSYGIFSSAYYSPFNGAGGATNMSRATNFVVGDHASATCTMSGGITDCAAFGTESAGQGQAHNNMMPYLALAYIIQYEPDTPPEPTMLYYGTTAVIPVAPSGAYLTGRRG